MRISESRLRRLIRDVIKEISLPKPAELRDTYRYKDLDNANNWKGNRAKSTRDWEKNRAESMRNTYPNLYRNIEDEETNFDGSDDSPDNPIYAEFPENDEIIFYKNLVDFINDENDEFVVLGDDGVSIKHDDEALEKEINKIANAHFSLHGRPSPDIITINKIKRLVKPKKDLPILSSQYDIDNI